MSEIVFRAYYDRLVRRAGDPPAVEFLLGYDSQPIHAEKSLYDLTEWARTQPSLADYLTTTPSTEILRCDPPSIDPLVWRQWRDRFDAHLARFGHVAYNLDFMAPVPADEPAPLLDTLRFHLSDHGGNPGERQRRSADRREGHTRAVRARLDPMRRALFNRLLRRAQETGPVREDGCPCERPIVKDTVSSNVSAT